MSSNKKRKYPLSSLLLSADYVNNSLYIGSDDFTSREFNREMLITPNSNALQAKSVHGTELMSRMVMTASLGRRFPRLKPIASVFPIESMAACP